MFRAIVICGGEGGVVESVEWAEFSSAMAAVVWAKGWLPDLSEDSVWGWFTSNLVFCGWGKGFTWRELWVVDDYDNGAVVRVVWGD